TPPAINRKMQCLAFRGRCCGLTASGFISALAASASPANIRASTSAPTPLQARQKRSLRENGGKNREDTGSPLLVHIDELIAVEQHAAYTEQRVIFRRQPGGKRPNLFQFPGVRRAP